MRLEKRFLAVRATTLSNPRSGKLRKIDEEEEDDDDGLPHLNSQKNNIKDLSLVLNYSKVILLEGFILLWLLPLLHYAIKRASLSLFGK